MSKKIDNQGNVKPWGAGAVKPGYHADSKGKAPEHKPSKNGYVGETSPEHVGNRAASDAHRGPVNES